MPCPDEKSGVGGRQGGKPPHRLHPVRAGGPMRQSMTQAPAPGRGRVVMVVSIVFTRPA